MTAALREADEEVGVTFDTVTVIGQVAGMDHGDWSYVYVVAATVTGRPLAVSPRTPESDELRWVPLKAVGGLPLHPAFGEAWPRLHDKLIIDC